MLADADAARASFLVTGDVDDFAEGDLATLRLTAIHPDLFMALRFPRHAYQYALDLLVANMKNPPAWDRRGDARPHRPPASAPVLRARGRLRRRASSSTTSRASRPSPRYPLRIVRVVHQASLARAL